MRSFIKGLMAGTILSSFLGSIMQPKKKPEIKELMAAVEGTKLKRTTNGILKKARRSVKNIIR